MAHVRSGILDEVGSRLTVVASGISVYEAGVLAVQNAPALAYEATSDQVTNTSKSGTEYATQYRTLTLAITVVATSPAERDYLAQQIEKSMAVDFEQSSELGETTIQATGEAERPLYGAQLTYEFTYVVQEDAPDVSL